MPKSRIITPSGVAITAPRFSIYEPLTPDEREVNILIGPPNAGKTLVANFLKNEEGCYHYSSSEALRRYAHRNSYPEILSQMMNGDIISLEHTKRVSEWDYRDCICYRRRAVMDGWGRIDDELEFALQLLSEHAVVRIVLLTASSDVLIERARNRNRGADDAIEIVKKRIQIFLDYYPGIMKVAKKYLHPLNIIEIETSSRTPDGVVSELRERLYSARGPFCLVA